MTSAAFSTVSSSPPPTLGRKQSSDHDDWLRSLAWIQANPNRARAMELVEEAAGRVRERLITSKKPAFGWSGGKDSIGLQIVMEAAGVERCVLAISALEYPEFLSWVTDNMPWGLSVELRSDLNMEWLAKNPQMLFPATAELAGKWFSKLQHSGQREFAKREGIDLLMLGRRKGDGNHVGTLGRYGHEYTDRLGFSKFSPIADWSHEDLLNVIVCYGRELPPCYSWPRGFRVGTGSWAARQWTNGVENGWREVYYIDPSVVENAARHNIYGARKALELCAG